MKFGYTIIYVPNVEKSLDFYERAFGLARRFLTDAGDYGELDTGGTTLVFASLELGASHLPGFLAACESERPLGFEVAFVASDVAQAHGQALEAGATEVQAPKSKPWGVGGFLCARPWRHAGRNLFAYGLKRDNIRHGETP